MEEKLEFTKAELIAAFKAWRQACLVNGEIDISEMDVDEIALAQADELIYWLT